MSMNPPATAVDHADPTIDGWQQAMWAGAAVMAVLFVYVLVRGPQRAAVGARVA